MTTKTTVKASDSESDLKAQRAVELEQIRTKAGGVLKPEDVVEFARKPSTALHSWFTWDDGDAAEAYRLWQARQVIRISVTIIPQPKQEPVRMYVSLQEDRGVNGYRLLTDVLSDEEMREKLLKQALMELNIWKAKYSQLQKLAPVFAAAEKVERAMEKGKKGQKRQQGQDSKGGSGSGNGRRLKVAAGVE